MGTIKVTKKVTESIEYSPCIKCGSDDIRFINCGYSSFNVGSATCQKCGNKVEVRWIPWNAPDSDLIPDWNAENDPKLLRKRYVEQIEEIQKLIDNLPDNEKIKHEDIL